MVLTLINACIHLVARRGYGFQSISGRVAAAAAAAAAAAEAARVAARGIQRHGDD